MNNKLAVIIQEQGLAKSDVIKMVEAFGGPFEEAGEVLESYKTIVVTDETQLDVMQEARDKRLILKNARTTVENKRKELKSDIVKQGRAIDTIARYVKEEIEPAEAYLKLQEKFVELKQAKEAAELKAQRAAELLKYTDDISIYNLDAMTQEQFSGIVNKLEAEQKAKQEAEAAAERQRLADIEAEQKRQAAIEAENAKLRAEAEEREKAHQAEQARLAKEQAKKDAETQAIRDRIQKEADEKLAVERAIAEEERKKREALEAEQRAQAEAVAKAQAEREAAELKALLSPDKDKIIKFCDALDLIRAEKLPAVKSKQAQDLVTKIEQALFNLSNGIKAQAKEL